MQYSPGEYIALTRQLEDPTDSTTRYVQAYVYKYKGGGVGVLLATLELVDKGSQRFEYLYQTPQDSDPYSLNIIIKVFSDSGYTAESTRYERTYQTYLIAERWGLMYGGGGGGGSDISYDKVRKIVKEEIEKIPKQIQKEVNFNPILDAVDELDKNISYFFKTFKIPEPEKIDLEPIVRAIDNTKKEIKNIKIPESEKVNLSPILSGLDDIERKLISKNDNQTDEINNQFKENVEKGFKEIKEEIKNVSFVTLKADIPEKKEQSKRRIFV